MHIFYITFFVHGLFMYYAVEADSSLPLQTRSTVRNIVSRLVYPTQRSVYVNARPSTLARSKMGDSPAGVGGR